MKLQIRKIIKQIIKDYGPQCKYFELDCPACRAYLCIRLLEDIFDVDVISKKVK